MGVDLLALGAVDDQQVLLADYDQVVVVVAESEEGRFEVWLELNQLVRKVSVDLQMALQELALSSIVEMLGVLIELSVGRDLLGDDRLDGVHLLRLARRRDHLDLLVLWLPALNVLLE